MGKHERQSPGPSRENRQDREDRPIREKDRQQTGIADDSYEAESETQPEEVEDATDEAEEDITGSSGLSKEIKIGLAAVVVLLVVLGGVVWHRMSHTAADSPPVADAKHSADEAGKKGHKASAAKTNKPTVVEAQPGTTGIAKKRPAGMDPWGPPVDKKQIVKDDGRAKSSPPSFMPSPTAANLPPRFEDDRSSGSESPNPLRSPAPSAVSGSSSNAPPRMVGLGTRPGAGDSLPNASLPRDPFARANPVTPPKMPVQPPTSAASRPWPTGNNSMSRGAPARSADEARRPDNGLAPQLPPRDEPRAQTSFVSGSRSGGRMYVTQEGDTLYDIARWQLGKASRWAEIYDLNRDTRGLQLDSLPAGIQLTLPDDSLARPNMVSERPSAGFQR